MVSCIFVRVSLSNASGATEHSQSSLFLTLPPPTRSPGKRDPQRVALPVALNCSSARALKIGRISDVHTKYMWKDTVSPAFWLLAGGWLHFGRTYILWHHTASGKRRGPSTLNRIGSSWTAIIPWVDSPPPRGGRSQ